MLSSNSFHAKLIPRNQPLESDSVGKVETEAYPYDLGSYSRKVTTNSDAAQTWFDRGRVWAYAFNHEEAARCFARAAEHDPRCAMAYWGLAYAVGPNYNKTWARYDAEDFKASAQRGSEALARATELIEQASPVEQALIRALVTRFPSANAASDETPATLDRAYADAMKAVHDNFPSDLEVKALYPESLMCIRPRQLWNLDTGAPTTQETVDARHAIEAGFALPGGHTHAALNHLYIHLMEMSQTVALALPAADRLRDLVPDGSHLQHMATHIDAAVGDYRHSIESNRRALGPTTSTLSATQRAAVFSCTPSYVSGGGRTCWRSRHQRMGGLWSITTAVTFYGRAIALGVLGRKEEARAERDKFEQARAAVPRERRWGVTAVAKEVLEVASLMCEGELVYREGEHDRAFDLLRRAVTLEDNLPYSDPPLWMQPVRHALGALLLEQGRSEEAEVAYRQDLGLSKDLSRRKARLGNVWGLHGLHESLVRNGKKDEAWALSLQKDVVTASADIRVAASCFCRVSAVGSRRTACAVPS
ncbi:tetratricopeptide TPR_2 repeat protein [Verticillium alfalfae VaMs.102]|uniref:Tetratricopeptide TPR_2 repeat protein n=1 Tax=Verticillium alfalfae (strain VaMs.102 / ATCC MYA-4576 / FGSC 10136) TaxID=526221 RepID=C9S768_VERA1|nr:tetratricopeptide TPR_2 repeat protein [Verticillium alfalfae VaMs.102]EEY14653.1 tetratricopeptide TPR_2 repeat protein [Verticillium alfalfae VaMs.102]